MNYLFFFPSSIKEMSPYSTLQPSIHHESVYLEESWAVLAGCWERRHRLFWKPSRECLQWRGDKWTSYSESRHFLL